MTKDIYLAAVEGGGTTFLASIARVIPPHHDQAQPATNTRFSIGSTTLEIIHTATFPPPNEQPPWTPHQILSAITTFFQTHRPSPSGYTALGIATFGPADVSPPSPHYGHILPGCPKREWRGVDLLSPLKAACQVENVGFDTDVNAPALAEFRHRCHAQQQQPSQQPSSPAGADAKGPPLTSLAYITVGTGVGVGLVINSFPVHGLLHPEGGHVPIHTLEGDAFGGYSWGVERSPFRGVGTVEGVTSSVALTERLLWMQREQYEEEEKDGGGCAKCEHDSGGCGADDATARSILSTLPDSHPLWSHASNAIANLCVTILLLTSCQRIVLEGGVMNRSILYDRIRREVLVLLNGYLDVEELSSEEKLKSVICASSWESLGVGSGLVGAFALALDSLQEEEEAGAEEKCDSALVTRRELKNGIERRKVFGLGIMAGIGLSMGCILLIKIAGRGLLRQH
ncbi:hypothetical protein HJC23_008474 [Cyclotella cryptica]|uniref:fructokinase n=1 Tax=Cyclotella cryptica TaxID=29204 RepID=A0ABD3QXD3_9STRA|eukprot:CCRYP_001207-RA/>CCRYP_001207-RA protein AED:0.03 eAED:0.01 QI:0/-1/0/1/-1/1/1/0/455